MMLRQASASPIMAAKAASIGGGFCYNLQGRLHLLLVATTASNVGVYYIGRLRMLLVATAAASIGGGFCAG
jgi:hypothetical protein